MNKICKSLTLVIILLLMFGCSKNGKIVINNNFKSINTARVYGSYPDFDFIVIFQSNGETRCCVTTPKKPDFNFTNIPAGQCLIIFNVKGITIDKIINIEPGQSYSLNIDTKNFKINIIRQIS